MSRMAGLVAKQICIKKDIQTKRVAKETGTYSSRISEFFRGSRQHCDDLFLEGLSKATNVEMGFWKRIIEDETAGRSLSVDQYLNIAMPDPHASLKAVQLTNDGLREVIETETRGIIVREATVQAVGSGAIVLTLGLINSFDSYTGEGKVREIDGTWMIAPGEGIQLLSNEFIEISEIGRAKFTVHSSLKSLGLDTPECVELFHPFKSTFDLYVENRRKHPILLQDGQIIGHLEVTEVGRETVNAIPANAKSPIRLATSNNV